MNIATTRLERAVARIERACAQRDSAGNGVAEALAALDARHKTLRARIQQTIEQLDGLIAQERPR